MQPILQFQQSGKGTEGCVWRLHLEGPGTGDKIGKIGGVSGLSLVLKGNDDRSCGHSQAGGRRSIPLWSRFQHWQRHQAHSCSTIRPKMKIAVLQIAKGCRACGCAQAQRRSPLALEYPHRRTGYTAGTERKLKSAAAGGDCRVRMGSHRSIPPRRTRPGGADETHM
jgi:hypothetical protein